MLAELAEREPLARVVFRRRSRFAALATSEAAEAAVFSMRRSFDEDVVSLAVEAVVRGRLKFLFRTALLTEVSALVGSA